MRHALLCYTVPTPDQYNATHFLPETDAPMVLYQGVTQGVR